jgi:hypothetical protein
VGVKELTLDVIRDNCEIVGRCWMWNGYVNSRGGYPRAWIDGQGQVSVRSHVFKDILGKTVRKGFVISSRCGNPACVSPRCLISKSHSRSISDSYNSGARKIASGRQRLNVKLSMDIARLIRASSEPSAVLAARFGVHKATINSVRSGARWAEPKPVPHSSIFNLASYFMQEAA